MGFFIFFFWFWFFFFFFGISIWHKTVAPHHSCILNKSINTSIIFPWGLSSNLYSVVVVFYLFCLFGIQLFCRDGPEGIKYMFNFDDYHFKNVDNAHTNWIMFYLTNLFQNIFFNLLEMANISQYQDWV